MCVSVSVSVSVSVDFYDYLILCNNKSLVCMYISFYLFVHSVTWLLIYLCSPSLCIQIQMYVHMCELLYRVCANVNKVTGCTSTLRRLLARHLVKATITSETLEDMNFIFKSIYIDR